MRGEAAVIHEAAVEKVVDELLHACTNGRGARCACEMCGLSQCLGALTHVEPSLQPDTPLAPDAADPTLLVSLPSEPPLFCRFSSAMLAAVRGRQGRGARLPGAPQTKQLNAVQAACLRPPCGRAERPVATVEDAKPSTRYAYDLFG
eukprot:351455-Chlamydomonas_euryale.AAC.3